MKTLQLEQYEIDAIIDALRVNALIHSKEGYKSQHKIDHAIADKLLWVK